MNTIMKLTDQQAQDQCAAIGTPRIFEMSGSFTYLAGLCPRCHEPIQICLTNGGKLSPARTLRCYHIFSGSVRCEDTATNDLLAAMPAANKSAFFAKRHDQEVIKDLPPELQQEIMARLWGQPAA